MLQSIGASQMRQRLELPQRGAGLMDVEFCFTHTREPNFAVFSIEASMAADRFLRSNVLGDFSFIISWVKSGFGQLWNARCSACVSAGAGSDQVPPLCPGVSGLVCYKIAAVLGLFFELFGPIYSTENSVFHTTL